MPHSSLRSFLSAIEDLWSLVEKGALTRPEFERIKARLLAEFDVASTHVAMPSFPEDPEDDPTDDPTNRPPEVPLTPPNLVRLRSPARRGPSNDAVVAAVGGAAPAPRPRLGGVRFDMVEVPPGSFLMGANDDDEVALRNERPQRRVTITRPFLLGATPVTQAFYHVLTGERPSYFKSGPDSEQRPVEQVQWLEAVGFCNQLSELEGLEPAYHIQRSRGSGEVEWNTRAGGYRLPTEAEWEYAARAGGRNRYAGSDQIDAVAWFQGNSGNQTHAVGCKHPNGWGLFDMSGNVWEWIWDGYRDYPGGNVVDPVVAPDNGLHLSRGGCFGMVARWARVSYRYWLDPNWKASDLGFRLARTLTD